MFTFPVTIFGGSIPLWVTSAGSLPAVTENTSYNYQLVATGLGLVYTIVGGSLPPGITLSSSGLLSGTASGVASDTTFNFTVRATNNTGGFSNRSFSILVTDVVSGTVEFGTGAPSNSTDGQYAWVVPTGVNSIQVKAWGAGGSNNGVSNGLGDTYGGGGGFVKGTLAVTPGQTLQVVVGSGGRSWNALVFGGVDIGYNSGNFGGRGYNYNGVTLVYTSGGYSGVFNSSVSHANALFIAGGGGCGGTNSINPYGGGGGGLTGLNGYDTASNNGAAVVGKGGTQLAGGAVGSGGGAGGTASTAGSALQGGQGYSNVSGAGGGGYYGGGGGGSSSSGGGGGSSYYIGSATNTSTDLGSIFSAGGTSDSQYSTQAGYGANGGVSITSNTLDNTAGRNGRVVINWGSNITA